jgi:hypothetical protein
MVRQPRITDDPDGAGAGLKRTILALIGLVYLGSWVMSLPINWFTVPTFIFTVLGAVVLASEIVADLS